MLQCHTLGCNIGNAPSLLLAHRAVHHLAKPEVDSRNHLLFLAIKLAQLETPIARYKPGQKEKSGNSCCFQHIDHLFLGHHHHITGTQSQNDQGTIKT